MVGVVHLRCKVRSTQLLRMTIILCLAVFILSTRKALTIRKNEDFYSPSIINIQQRPQAQAQSQTQKTKKNDNNDFDFVYDKNWTALWLGTIDHPQLMMGEANQNNGHSENGNNDNDNDNNLNHQSHRVHFIISHCDKSLDWIWNDIQTVFGTTDRKFGSSIGNRYNLPVVLGNITIYSKCGKQVEGLPLANSTTATLSSSSSHHTLHLEGNNNKNNKNNNNHTVHVTIQHLANVGRCDHTYAYHLCHMPIPSHDNNKDVFFFFKDNPQRMEWWGRRSWEEFLAIAIRNGFACIEQEETFRQTIHPSFYHDVTQWRTFSVSSYQREIRRDTNEAFPSPKYKNLGDWIDRGLQWKKNWPQDLVPVCYGGVFAATWHQILQVTSSTSSSSNLWCRMAETLSRADNIEEGHFCERTWAALLSKPLRPKAAYELRHPFKLDEMRNSARNDMYVLPRIPHEIKIQCKARWKNRCGALTHQDLI